MRLFVDPQLMDRDDRLREGVEEGAETGIGQEAINRRGGERSKAAGEGAFPRLCNAVLLSETPWL